MKSAIIGLLMLTVLVSIGSSENNTVQCQVGQLMVSVDLGHPIYNPEFLFFSRYDHDNYTQYFAKVCNSIEGTTSITLDEYNDNGTALLDADANAWSEQGMKPKGGPYGPYDPHNANDTYNYTNEKIDGKDGLVLVHTDTFQVPGGKNGDLMIMKTYAADFYAAPNMICMITSSDTDDFLAALKSISVRQMPRPSWSRLVANASADERGHELLRELGISSPA